MNFKVLISAVMFGFIFFIETAQAYDLPKIVPDKSSEEKKSVGASDWTGAKLFEEKIKILLAEKGKIPPSSKERINRDKNLVFVAFYKGNAYFLDKYSIKIVKKNSKRQSWKQHIFPVGQNVSPKNSTYTMQKFCLQNDEFFNSLKNRHKISEIENEEDREFLAECFRVGYYYAFKKEIDEK